MNDSGSNLQEPTDAAIIAYVAVPGKDPAAHMAEMSELAATAGVSIVGTHIQSRAKPARATLLGKGSLDQLHGEVAQRGASCVIFANDLAPAQLRNVEDALECRVLDRTQLILEIFHRRARSKEGQLQVELAQLGYALPRLRGRGIELSRLGGGIATRGPGETKLEADRRRARNRISDLKSELESVRKHRKTQRKARTRMAAITATLVGYTSAGKSTLLNALAGSDVYVDPQLFATLDPTTRRLDLPNGGSVLLTDTVGFIKNLPHTLVAAFRATLEEVALSDFLVHVVDISHDDWRERVSAVEDVLREIGAEGKPTVSVYNKSDLISDSYYLRKLVSEKADSVYVSARTGDGLPLLVEKIEEMTHRLLLRVEVLLPTSRGDLLSLAYERGTVFESEYVDEGIRLRAEVPPPVAHRLNAADTSHKK